MTFLRVRGFLALQKCGRFFDVIWDVSWPRVLLRFFRHLNKRTVHCSEIVINVDLLEWKSSAFYGLQEQVEIANRLPCKKIHSFPTSGSFHVPCVIPVFLLRYILSPAFTIFRR